MQIIEFEFGFEKNSPRFIVMPYITGWHKLSFLKGWNKNYIVRMLVITIRETLLNKLKFE